MDALDAGAPLNEAGEDFLIAALTPDSLPKALVAAMPVELSASCSVRLNVDLLDRMMSSMSDMVLARNELARRLRDGDIDPKVEAAFERLSLTVADMRDTVTRTRMQKVEALFSVLPRMVRDTSAELRKAVNLVIEGADVELDREMIELMRDPLVQIIRNLIDYGIETPAARRTAGKAETGCLVVSARQPGNQILIEISDDGRGIDVARIVAKAAQRGLYSQAELAAMSEASRLELIFVPGRSSRDAVTATSGRGVGLDVVRANIQADRRPCRAGKRSRARFADRHPRTADPLDLSTIIVGVSSQRFALPRQAIVMVRGHQVRLNKIGDAVTAMVRGRRIPPVWLATLSSLGTAAPPTLVIVSTREGNYALGVDTVLDTKELVVNPVSPAVRAAAVYAGLTLPDNGLPMLVLDASGIAAIAGPRFARIAAIDASVAEAAVPGVPVLLFDDLDGQRCAIALPSLTVSSPFQSMRSAGLQA
jgi:two-component system chemotaxis sensor kinase CheA